MTHREISFALGSTIDEAMQILKEFHTDEQYFVGNFNGQKLYSDVDDINSAYKKVTGKTKTEWDAADKKRQHDYQEKERKHKAAIPRLTRQWISKGKKVLDEKYHAVWAEMVPIRLDDLYKGAELGAVLEIVKALNDQFSNEWVKEIIDAQGHSGMSFGLVCAMVRSLCDRGEEFVSFIQEN